jgi:integrase/recombinase XerD
VFKITADAKQYAECLVNGKTGSRHFPLISSIPYIKDWLDAHPQRGNSNAYLIPNLSDKGRLSKLGPMAYGRFIKIVRQNSFPIY